LLADAFAAKAAKPAPEAAKNAVVGAVVKKEDAAPIVDSSKPAAETAQQRRFARRHRSRDVDAAKKDELKPTDAATAKVLAITEVQKTAGVDADKATKIVEATLDKTKNADSKDLTEVSDLCTKSIWLAKEDATVGGADDKKGAEALLGSLAEKDEKIELASQSSGCIKKAEDVKAVVAAAPVVEGAKVDEKKDEKKDVPAAGRRHRLNKRCKGKRCRRHRRHNRRQY